MLFESSKQTNNRKKMSYSISSLSQFLIKEAADKSGATQGSIVELAPLLFGKIILDSIERRAKSINTLKTLEKQIISSLKLFKDTAPHLSPYTDLIAGLISELIEMEKQAVDNQNYQGAESPGEGSVLGCISQKNINPPYYKEIEDHLNGNKLLKSLFSRYKTN